MLYRDIWFDKPPLLAAVLPAVGRYGRLAAAAGGCALRPAGVLDCVRVCARIVERTGRALGGGPAGFFPDVRFSFRGDSGGVRPVDGGAAPGGGLAGVEAEAILGRRGGRRRVLDQSQGCVCGGGVRVVGSRRGAVDGRGIRRGERRDGGGAGRGRRARRLLGGSLEVGPAVCGVHVRRKSRARGADSDGELGGVPRGGRFCGGSVSVEASAMEVDRLAGAFGRRRVRGAAILPTLLFPAAAGSGSYGRARVRHAGAQA